MIISDDRRETLVGVATALALGVVLVIVAASNQKQIQIARGGKAGGVFALKAAFNHADGIYTGAPVRLAGVNIGTVSEAELNADRHAVLTFLFTNPVSLPDDTAAVIETDGLFGSKYIELRPGGADDALKAGGTIAYTQDSVILEDLVTQIVARAKAKAKTDKEAESEKQK